MIRLRLFALAAAILVTPALSQVTQVRPITPGIVVPVVPPAATVVQDNSDVAQKVMTIEEAQAQIARLKAHKRDLTLKLNDSNAKLTETLATLDEWTRKGGSLVHAYCESDEVSRSSAGAIENCAASGYACSPVEGTCRRSCNVTTDCAGYHVCDTAAHVCVHN